jgi:hypothetical protein
MGAVFAPSFRVSPDPVRFSFSVESKAVPHSMGVKSSSRRDVAFDRLEELILTHRSIAVSA